MNRWLVNALGAAVWSVLLLLAPAKVAAAGFQGKKVLYVDSYHAEYKTSGIKQRAMRAILEPEGIEMAVVYLDEKRRGDEESLRAAAGKAVEAIRQIKPDVIIAADDAATKYVVVRHFRDDPLPIVFFDVNWTAEPYGLPFRNTTGQTEVELVRELVETLRRFSRGPRLAMLSADTMTDRKTVEYCRTVLGLRFSAVRLVATFAKFKDAYRELQKDADMIFLHNHAGITGWDDAEAQRFVGEVTAVPTGGVTPAMAPFTLVNLAKVNEEGAQWAAEAVLKILAGTPPSAIPMTSNKRGTMILNMTLAKHLGIVFPMEMVNQADFVEELEK